MHQYCSKDFFSITGIFLALTTKTKIMRKFLSMLAVTAMFSLLACSNDKKEDKSATEGADKIETTVKDAASSTTQLAVHTCTAACKDDNHLFVHGEQGHTCSEACMKSTGRPHSCTEKCSDGSHTFAHGEDGHSCTTDCGNM